MSQCGTTIAPHIVEECEAIRDLLLQNIYAIRADHSGTGYSGKRLTAAATADNKNNTNNHTSSINAANCSPSTTTTCLTSNNTPNPHTNNNTHSNASSSSAPAAASNAAPSAKTTTIQAIASRIYKVTQTPNAFAFLFDVLREAIEADMIEHFIMPVMSGRYGEYVANSADTFKRIQWLRAGKTRKREEKAQQDLILEQRRRNQCFSSSCASSSTSTNSNPLHHHEAQPTPQRHAFYDEAKFCENNDDLLETLGFTCTSSQHQSSSSTAADSSAAGSPDDGAAAVSEEKNTEKKGAHLIAYSRDLFSFITTFTRTFPIIVKSIKFSVQYIDSAYGTRCRNFTLTDFAYRTIETSFRLIQKSLFDNVALFVNEIRVETAAANANISSSSSASSSAGTLSVVSQSTLRDMVNVVQFILHMSERNFSPNTQLHHSEGGGDGLRGKKHTDKHHVSIIDAFLAHNALAAEQCYNRIGAEWLAKCTQQRQQLQSACLIINSSSSAAGGASDSAAACGGSSRGGGDNEFSVTDYCRWVAAQIESERLLLNALLTAAVPSSSSSDSSSPPSSLSAATAAPISLVGDSTRKSSSPFDANYRRWLPMRASLYEALVRPVMNVLVGEEEEDFENEDAEEEERRRRNTKNNGMGSNSPQSSSSSSSAFVAAEIEAGRDISAFFTLLQTAATEDDCRKGILKMANAVQQYARRRVEALMATSLEAIENGTFVVVTQTPPTPSGSASSLPPPPSREVLRQQQLVKNFQRVVEFATEMFESVWPRQLKRNNFVLTGLVKGFKSALKNIEEVPKLHSDVVDAFMKKEALQLEDNIAATEAKLGTFSRIFEAIVQKDEFLTHYKARLAMRLLKQSTFSLGTENLFIRDMRAMVGNSATHHLSAMINDVLGSKTLTSTFNELVWKEFVEQQEADNARKMAENAASLTSVNGAVSSSTAAAASGVMPSNTNSPSSLFNNGRPAVKVNFILATSQYWPSMDRIDVKFSGPNFAPTIGTILGKIQSYYAARHTTRKINWSVMTSTAVVSVLFNKVIGLRQVEGTLLQAAVLLCIDDHSYSEQMVAFTGSKKNQQKQQKISDEKNDAADDDNARETTAAAAATTTNGGVSVDGAQLPPRRIGLSPAQIAERSGLSLDIVRDTLASMAFDPRANILSTFDAKTNAVVTQRVIKDEFPHFQINTATFKTQFKKIELPKPRSAKNANAISAADQQRQILEMRRINAQISVVRFMKSRGTAIYNDMLTAVLADLRVRFDAQPVLVKQTLDYLIEKEYVRRDEEDRSKLIYIA